MLLMNYLQKYIFRVKQVQLQWALGIQEQTLQTKISLTVPIL